MKYFAAIGALVFTAYAAGPAGRFEVASIKPSAPGGRGCILNSTFSNLQIRPADCPVKTLITAAWSLAPWELDITKAPAWISSDHFDINAKAPSPTSARGLTNMLGPLLEDRFRLKRHREKRQLPVYFLTAAKSGVKLSATKAGGCTPYGLGLGMEGRGVPMASLVSHLTALLGRPVIDNTGFTGIFDLHLKFARDSSLAFGGLPDRGGQPAETGGWPNIFTAIRNVGLNITPDKGPVDVFVIDSVQKPTDN